ncbi:MAG: helix-turn-helix domain-containing protein [Magnetospirillum sp.]|nr:helix-turn-helix domain-containing protein [Magnetospirillum sp.]
MSGPRPRLPAASARPVRPRPSRPPAVPPPLPRCRPGSGARLPAAKEPSPCPFFPAPLRGRRRRSADPIDAHLGARIRLRRTLMGLSQTELGRALGVTFQQVQKYERGTNRLSAAMLYRLTRVLDVPLGFFFDDLPDHIPLPAAAGSPPWRETLDMLRAYATIPDNRRHPVYALVRALAEK